MVAIREDLQAVLDRYTSACRVSDAPGCAAVFAPDAEMYSPYGRAVRGREAISKTHEVWTAGGSEGTEAGSGTSLMVFQRDASQGWQIRMRSLNAAVPAD